MNRQLSLEYTLRWDLGMKQTPSPPRPSAPWVTREENQGAALSSHSAPKQLSIVDNWWPGHKMGNMPLSH